MIMDTMEKRYHRLYPGWKVAFISLLAGSPEWQREQAQVTIDFIKNNWLKD